MRGDIIIVEEHHRAAAAQVVAHIAETVAAKPGRYTITVSTLR